MAGKQSNKRSARPPQAIHQRAPDELRRARARFSSLSVAEQMQLARELVQTRAGELCRAYPDVVSVAFGYKKKTNAGTGKSRLQKQPCIRFTVARKRSRVSADRSIPKHLLAFWEVEGERRLCAVQTDVLSLAEEGEARPQDGGGIINATPPGGRAGRETGMVACPVKRSVQNATFVIGCRHVFSITASLHPERLLDGAVRMTEQPSGALLAETRPIIGDLLDGPGFSLDAQLAQVVDPAQLRAAFGNLKLRGFIQSVDAIPAQFSTFHIHTSRGVIKATFEAITQGPINYGRTSATKVLHDELLQLLPTRLTTGGDSGSPVTTEAGGGLLAGMHIAGLNRSALVIPAWDLLNPRRYNGTTRSETWTVMDPADAPDTAPAAVPDAAAAAEPPGAEGLQLAELMHPHNAFGGVSWQLARDGIRIGGNAPEVTSGAPQTVGRVWNSFGSSIERWSRHYNVPAELIIATICTETRGDPAAIRKEPGYVSDEATPSKISPGLMQTLIATAREALGDPSITREWLLVADNSIRAGTAYIDRQRSKTQLDPPKVACAYNAGGVHRNNGAGNRWKMRQFPIGTSEHADRFIAWFNDCFRLFPTLASPPSLSLWGLVR